MRPVRAKALIINAFALTGRFSLIYPYTLTIFAFLMLNTPRPALNKIFGAKFLSFEHLETMRLYTACYEVF